jgi:hypothetical protein
MTTVQESTNGHRVLPPPFSIENPGEPKPADLPTDKANNNQFANDDQVAGRQKGVPITPLLAHEKVNAYHVPPARYSPKAHAYRRDDTLDLPPETTPLPERCQFMFSDGRQCTMARSEIHPSLCTFHSEREDQLFGTPSSRGSVVGAGFDLPELYSACHDLTTAAGVNRALAQVFRLLAQRRISRQEAATFGHLAQLLLRSISLARTETVASASENEQPMTPVVELQPSTVPACRPHSPTQDQPSPVNKAIPGEPLPTDESTRRVCAPAPSERDLPQIAQNQQIRNSSRNPNKINSYKIIEDKTVQNQHIYKTDSGGAVRVPLSPKRGDRI